jgi:hypothetical protein
MEDLGGFLSAPCPQLKLTTTQHAMAQASSFLNIVRSLQTPSRPHSITIVSSFELFNMVDLIMTVAMYMQCSAGMLY